MAEEKYVLIDAPESVAHDGVVAEGSTMSSQWQVRLRTCRGGRSEGVQIVELDNGNMCLDVLPTRGMGIWRARRGSKTLGWQSPSRQPVHPAFVPLMEPAGLGWLEGFNELLCRCGLESNGPPEFDEAGRLLRPLHGRIANTPAHRLELLVDDEGEKLTLRGVVDESRFHFQSLRLTTSISTAIGSNEFSWSDEVENIGGREATLQMLYHFNIGQPLLQAGARITAPIATVAPLNRVAAKEGVERWHTVPPPRSKSSEQVFVLQLLGNPAGDTRVLVNGLEDKEAVGLCFNKRTLPCFTIWRNTPSEADGYVLGIEPGTNYPNPRTFEADNGRVIKLKAGEKWSATLAATWHTDAKLIAAEEAAIKSIQRTQTLELVRRPRPQWSANP